MRPQRCVLLKYGEMALKGRNRGWFEQHLERALLHAVGSDQRRPRLRWRSGVVAVSAPWLSTTELTERLGHVLGISVLQPALRVGKSPDEAADAAVRVVRERHADRLADGSDTRFAVRARRRDKNFPLNSEGLAAFVGARVGEVTGWSVDLDNPDVRIDVEVDRFEVFVSADRQRGSGGLPVGCSGHALVLLSGGYDSPVAAYRAMRRGLRCDFVHFTGAPYTGPSSAYKAYALVRQLSQYQPDARLYTVPVGRGQKALATGGAGSMQIVAQRRLFLRCAEQLATEIGAEALVTGDSLGQVSSQTLSNLVTVTEVARLPLLRPLLAWDKEEIIDEARRIGTAEIAALPDEDCCQLLAPPRVSTRSDPEKLSKLENRVGLDDLVDDLLAHARLLTPEPSEPAALAE